ncbi:hypothetical protein XENORESO_011276 [Xenotaenia resolanae]|uniref:4Fe-4S ferredoxin-type domain-containing protein n=1 Tax=Xenotaenia resolanae TaxID=208358 RepID=A0ABV0WBF0_9TELE
MSNLKLKVVSFSFTCSGCKFIDFFLYVLTDTQWFLVIIVLLCAGIALVVVTKIKPLLHWIRSNQVYFLDHKPVTVPLRAMDDDVSKPVQEVCGKCDHCIDLCIKE